MQIFLITEMISKDETKSLLVRADDFHLNRFVPQKIPWPEYKTDRGGEGGRVEVQFQNARILAGKNLELLSGQRTPAPIQLLPLTL